MTERLTTGERRRGKGVRVRFDSARDRSAVWRSRTVHRTPDSPLLLDGGPQSLAQSLIDALRRVWRSGRRPEGAALEGALREVEEAGGEGGEEGEVRDCSCEDSCDKCDGGRKSARASCEEVASPAHVPPALQRSELRALYGLGRGKAPSRQRGRGVSQLTLDSAPQVDLVQHERVPSVLFATHRQRGSARATRKETRRRRRKKRGTDRDGSPDQPAVQTHALRLVPLYVAQALVLELGLVQQVAHGSRRRARRHLRRQSVPLQEPHWGAGHGSVSTVGLSA